MFKEPLYDYGVIIVKRFGDIDKIMYLGAVKNSGLECECNKVNRDKNAHKLFNNITRAKSKIQEYALCNDWDYFATLTVSPDQFDRYNLKEIYKSFSKWVNNYNRKGDLKYIIVPEKHKDGAWHFHGLIKGIKQNDLFINQYGYFDWLSYKQHFGFASLSPIRDKVRVSYYITKYLTKALGQSIEKGDHLFYSSNGLQTGKVLLKGHYNLLPEFKWDYENEDGTYKCFTFNNQITDYTEFLR